MPEAPDTMTRRMAVLEVFVTLRAAIMRCTFAMWKSVKASVCSGSSVRGDNPPAWQGWSKDEDKWGGAAGRMLLSLLCFPGFDVESGGLPSCRARNVAWRVGYLVLFLGYAVAMWVFRDLPPPANASMPALDEAPSRQERQLLVMRVALSSALFFACHIALLLALPLISAPQRSASREVSPADWVQCSFWLLKVLLAFALSLACMYPPDHRFRDFFQVARVGGVLFIVIQVAVVIEFVYSTSDFLISRADAGASWARAVLVLGSLFICCCCIVAIALAFEYFAPPSHMNNCARETAFIAVSSALGPLLIALHAFVPKSPGNLLTSSLIWAYLIFLVVSSLLALTDQNRCDGSIINESGQALYTQIFSFIISIGAVVYSVYSSSQDVDSVGLDVVQRNLETPELFEWRYFHLVFMLGSLHVSQLLIGWSLDTEVPNWTLDKGEWSSTLKAATCWLTAVLYGWSLCAPAICPGRFETARKPAATPAEDEESAV